MTSETPPEITPEPIPEDVVDGASSSGALAAGELAMDPDEEKRRRRKAALLILLVALLGALALFTGWYLIYRKPVTELPLPGLNEETVPHYAYSLYGVIAPTGVAVSPDGSRVYVTQTEQDTAVLIFNGEGTKLATVKPPATTGTEHVPVYLALNPTSGDLYVSDRPAGAIYIYSAEGIYRRTFDPGKDLKGWQPLGLAFDPKGDLFVTDVSGPFNTVHEFATDGTPVRTLGKEGQFNFPNGLAVDAAGNLYVANSSNGQLNIFDPTGGQIAMVKRGAAAGDLGLPRGTAIDDGGRVYVVDTTAQGVQLYHVLTGDERAPKYIGRFGVEGTQEGAFQYPNGVAVDTRARIYVTDWRNNRVQVWTY